MKKFKLSGVVTISIYTEVEADSIEEAIEIAENRTIEANNWGDKSQASDVWVSDEFDGMPDKIREID